MDVPVAVNRSKKLSSTTATSWVIILSSMMNISTCSEHQLQYTSGPRRLPATTVSAPSTASSYFPLADANGNAVTYSDEAGNVQAHYVYDAFGGTVSSDGDMDDVFHFRFSSKYLDDETGLYYYGYRFYDPAPGRWLSRDPIGERGGLLLYGFVENDGFNWIDLLGLIFRWAGDPAEYEKPGNYLPLWGPASMIFSIKWTLKEECCDDEECCDPEDAGTYTYGPHYFRSNAGEKGYYDVWNTHKLDESRQDTGRPIDQPLPDGGRVPPVAQNGKGSLIIEIHWSTDQGSTEFPDDMKTTNLGWGEHGATWNIHMKHRWTDNEFKINEEKGGWVTITVSWNCCQTETGKQCPVTFNSDSNRGPLGTPGPTRFPNIKERNKRATGG